MHRAIRYFFRLTLIFTIILLGRAPALSDAITPNTIVTFERAIIDAERLVSLNNDWKIMRGSGRSMLPYYGDNSVLIVETASYNKLQMGMSVIYRGHSLQGKSGNDWYARGFNNKKQDPQLVTERNYVGVIFGILSGISGGGRANGYSSDANYPIVHGKKY
jgi:hypothetical protein